MLWDALRAFCESLLEEKARQQEELRRMTPFIIFLAIFLVLSLIILALILKQRS